VALGAVAVVAAGAVTWGVTREPEPSGPVAFDAAPCWGLVPKEEFTPSLAAGRAVDVTNSDLGLVSTNLRTGFCRGVQEGGATFSGVVEWHRRNPFPSRSPDYALRWRPPLDAESALESRPDWGLGGETWPFGARVAVSCNAPDPKGLDPQDAGMRFLSVQMVLHGARGVDQTTVQRTAEKLAVELARAVAPRLGCTNDLNLPKLNGES
jgi:hypothetical protein